MKIIPKYALNAEDVRGLMLESIEKHLTLKTEGYRTRTAQTIDLLLKAVAEGSSLEAVCADSGGAVAANTLREQLNAALDVAHLREQEAEMNRALQAAIPVGMPRGGLEVAIDTHDEPFYGKPPALRAYTCKTRAKDGTTHFCGWHLCWSTSTGHPSRSSPNIGGASALKPPTASYVRSKC
jgi:hypothetical protein